MTPMVLISIILIITASVAVFRWTVCLARSTSGVDLFSNPRLTVMWLELLVTIVTFVLVCDGSPEALNWFLLVGLAFSALFTWMNLSRTNPVQAVALGLLQGMTGALGAILIRFTKYSRPLEAYAEPNYPMSPVQQDNPMPQLPTGPSLADLAAEAFANRPVSHAPCSGTVCSATDSSTVEQAVQAAADEERRYADEAADAYARRLGFRDAHDAERGGFNTGHSSYR